MDLPEGLTKEVVAQVLGYASIGSWLCAQAPQVVKNWRNASCEGLALPFLVTWLFGDITNLLGCLLTDQLPFQTYLAIYFCLVDLCLVSQYFYYTRRSHHRTSVPTTPASLRLPQTTQSPHLHHSLYLPQSQNNLHFPSAPDELIHRHVRSVSHPSLTRQPSQNNGIAVSRPSRRRHPAGSFTANHPGTDTSYQAIFEAALDVARAAERVRSGTSTVRSHSRRPLSRRAVTERLGHATLDGSPSDMIESFHSERSSRSGVSTDNIHDSPIDMTASAGTLTDRRGRTMHRSDVSLMLPENEAVYITSGETSGEALDGLIQAEAAAGGRVRSKSRSLSLARGSSGRGTGRRAAGVAFMGLWCFFGINRFGPGRLGLQGLSRQSRAVGRVVPQEESALVGDWRGWESIRQGHQESTLAFTTIITAFDTTDAIDPSQPHQSPKPLPPPPSMQRLIGRVSAWTCTTLYLSSRLPQIWLNFTRKSVEGLSILLFFFAFCGNLCYVISIILNPSGNGDPAEATRYLLEALPYLLGSGGTLLFDITIMLQSVVYGSQRPVPSTPPQRRSHMFRRARRRVGWIEDGETRPLLIDRQRSRSPAIRRKTESHAVVLSPNETGLQIRFGADRPARQGAVVSEGSLQ